MAIHKKVEGISYTIKLLTPKLKGIGKHYQRLLDGLMENYIQFDSLHLGLKYMGYDKEYNDAYMMQFIPEIKTIAKKYLPLDLSVKGIAGFWSSPKWKCKPVIFLKVLPNKKLQQLHDEIREALGSRVDTFVLTEGKHYTPHITIGIGKPEFEAKLKGIARKSQKDKQFDFVATKIAMRLNGDKLKVILKTNS
ncbi:MAG: 2'-5' RNA ligase family protein [Candidatus Nanoarchaeia archaeon]|jgi:2'-5' RNA ligase